MFGSFILLVLTSILAIILFYTIGKLALGYVLNINLSMFKKGELIITAVILGILIVEFIVTIGILLTDVLYLLI